MIEKQIEITEKNRKLFIISASFLFLNSTFLIYIFNEYFEFDFFSDLVWSISRITAFGVLYLVLIKYFNYYRLKVLKILSILILIFFTCTQVLRILNYNKTIVPVTFDYYLDILSGILVIILMSIILKMNNNYVGFTSLKKYAITYLITILIFILYSISRIYFVELNDLTYLNWIILILGIPYIFMIEFGIKLKNKKPNSQQCITKIV